MNKKITLSAIDTQITPIIHAIQYDTDRQLECYFDDIDITGVTAARLYALKPDGTEVYTDCTLANGYIIAPLDSQTLAVVGTVNCQMQLTINGTLTTFLFNVIVDKSLVSSSAIPSSNEYSALETLIDEAQDVIDGLPSKVSKSGDSMSGNLDMTDNKIVNLGTPTADADAANKEYVDDADALNEKLANKVTTLDNSDDHYPSSKCVKDAIDAVPVITVDSALSDTSENPVQNKVVKNALDGKLSLSGGTMTGDIDLNGKNINNVNEIVFDKDSIGNTPEIYCADPSDRIAIKNVLTPQNDYWAANKKYVDDADALNEKLANKVTAFSSPTDTEYPSAKLVDDSLALKEDVANKVTSISAASTDTEYPSAKCMYDLIGDINTILANLATP